MTAKRMNRAFLTVLSALPLAISVLIGCGPTQTPTPQNATAAKPEVNDAPTATLPQRIDARHLPNAIRIHDKVISGGQPDGEQAFEELQQLGIRTIISVDGAKPDVEVAVKHGMRYVHLPHGYNGVPENRIAELAKAVREMDGPIYIHCHHGKHRSPAAATAACIAAGFIDPVVATSNLKFAGTSENYQGLYRSAAHARKIDNALLDALQADFPAIATLPPMAEAMVEVEHTFDGLKKLSANGWKTLAESPDLDAAHEALLLSGHFTELLRLESVAKESETFREMLSQSASDAHQLEVFLRENASNLAQVVQSTGALFTRISENCTACHRQFRDKPLE